MSDMRLEVDGFIIADELFTMGYPPGRGPYACAGGVCCGRGAYVDLKERDHVLAHAHLVKPVLDETQTLDETLWFETEIVDDPDYPSGKCVGTESPDHRCTLQDKHGRCSLQVAAITEGLHKWALKPRYCVIFPLDIIDNVIGFDPRMQGKQPCCSVRPDFAVPLFEACRQELVHLLGEQGYAKVQAHYETLRGRGS